MANDSNEALSLFEVPPAGAGEEDHSAPPARQRNALAPAGAALSFLPPLGLVLSAIGYARSRTRHGAGRKAALAGIALSVVLGGVEAYVGTTAPMFDSGCLNANSAATRLRALQAAPGGNLTLLASELDSVHRTLDSAASSADSDQVRTRLQLVASDVEAVSLDVTKVQTTGDMSELLTDETKLQSDGDAADSYCHSL